MPRYPRLLEPALVVLGLTALTIAATFPLILRMGSALPGDLGDPLFGAWLLGWDADRLREGLRGLWNAPILYPSTGTLAYAEHLLGIALFVAPVYWLSGNAVLTYNVAFLLAYIVAGGGMYLLARELTGNRPAAGLAAVIFAFGPMRAEHLSHLQLLTSGWMPIALWSLHRFLGSGSRLALAAFTAAFVLQALVNSYFLYYLTLAVVIIVGLKLWWRPRSWRAILPPLAVAGAAAVAVLSPIILAYLEVRIDQGLRRDYRDLVQFSADVQSYFKAAEFVRLWRWLPGPLAPERQLFQGLTAFVLAIVALSVRRKEYREGVKTRGSRRIVITYATLVVAAFLLSLGPEPRAWGLSFGRVGPYWWLSRIVPGMDGMRAPARLGVLVSLGLSVLAAVGASRLFQRSSASLRGAGVMLLGILAIADGWMAPIRLAEFSPVQRPDDRHAYLWLRSAPAGAVIELPILSWGINPTLIYQLGTLTHRHPIVNGYSGHGSALQELLGGAGSPLHDLPRLDRALVMLRALGVRFIVFHLEDYDSPAAAEVMLGALRQHMDQMIGAHGFGAVTVFHLKDAEPGVSVIARKPSPEPQGQPIAREHLRITASHAKERIPALTDEDLDPRWISGKAQAGDEWIRVDLDRPATVGRLQIRMARRSYGDYPRELLVEAVTTDGRTAPLFAGDVLVPLARGILADGAYPVLDLTFPPSEVAAVVLRQKGASRTWFWSVHELALWER